MNYDLIYVRKREEIAEIWFFLQISKVCRVKYNILSKSYVDKVLEKKLSL